MKKTRFVLLLSLTISVIFLITSIAYASSGSDYIEITKPVEKSTFYKGDTIPINVSVDSSFVDAYVLTQVDVTSGGNIPFSKEFPIIDKGMKQSFSTKVKTKLFESGGCTVMVDCIPVDNKGISIDPDDSNWEKESVDFSLKLLKPPVSVKAKAGKKKVRITFKKSPGASKYEIFRSTKKTKGFKKVATITNNKYTDKKVKKAKRYYYKLKSYRSKYGKVRSAFSKCVKTKRVK